MSRVDFEPEFLAQMHEIGWMHIPHAAVIFLILAGELPVQDVSLSQDQISLTTPELLPLLNASYAYFNQETIEARTKSILDKYVKIGVISDFEGSYQLTDLGKAYHSMLQQELAPIRAQLKASTPRSQRN